MPQATRPSGSTPPASRPHGSGRGRPRADWASAIVDALDSGVFVVDRAARIHFRNLAAKRLGPGDDLGKLLSDVRFSEAFRGWSEAIERVLTEGAAVELVGATATEHPAGSRLVKVHCVPLSDGSEPCLMALVRVEDDRATGVEGALGGSSGDASRRLASLGKLSARVAHELNNPLDGILRYVNLSLRMIGDTTESKLKMYLMECRTGLLRMARIIGDLLAYSRRSDGDAEDAAIHDVIEEAVRQHAAAAKDAHVVVALDLRGQDMPRARGSRLLQVCSNLIRNAIDAMPDGGRLTITNAVVGDDVVIEVADTGPGLPLGDGHRVFEPFFTTKPLGKGTGLGLSICRDFVEEMGGTIRASNGVKGGAVFTVRLPAARSPGLGKAPSDSASASGE